MSNDLLPPSATRLERIAARVNGTIDEIPIPLRTLWNPATCPVELLPYLAWAFSVDRWDDNWPESTKRTAVTDAFYLHRFKGTTSALRRVVEPFGYFIRITEWWDAGTAPGTFLLDIGLEDEGITEETFNELERLIDDVRPCSRTMLGLALYLQTTGSIPISAATYSGDTLTVYPYFPELIATQADDFTGAAIHFIDTLRVTDGN